MKSKYFYAKGVKFSTYVIKKLENVLKSLILNFILKIDENFKIIMVIIN
jgi:hypothetical protein